MKFEEKLKKINEILLKLENSEVSLEETVELYKEGSLLLADCKNEIEKAELIVSVKGENLE